MDAGEQAVRGAVDEAGPALDCGYFRLAVGRQLAARRQQQVQLLAGDNLVLDQGVLRGEHLAFVQNLQLDGVLRLEVGPSSTSFTMTISDVARTGTASSSALCRHRPRPAPRS